MVDELMVCSFTVKPFLHSNILGSLNSLSAKCVESTWTIFYKNFNYILILETLTA